MIVNGRATGGCRAFGGGRVIIRGLGLDSGRILVDRIKSNGSGVLGRAKLFDERQVLIDGKVFDGGGLFGDDKVFNGGGICGAGGVLDDK